MAHMPEFQVLQSYGPEAEKCAQDAMITAKCTGSTGATYSIVRDGVVHSMARVERAREKPFHINIDIEQGG